MAFAETCPQYLFLSLDDMGNGFEGAKFVCCPPLRPADHQEDLWRGLRTMTSSSSAPTTVPSTSTARRSWAGATSGRSPTACRASRTAWTCSTGVVEGGSSRERWVEVTSTAAAKIFGHGRAKGAIAPGFDADILVYDPERSGTSCAATHHMDVDYSSYEGREVQGASTWS